MDAKARKEWFESPQFAAMYDTQLPLGAFCEENGTLFRLWAPTAQKVILRLYPAGNGCEAMEAQPLEEKEQGCWEYRTDRNLEGVYYDYAVTADGTERITQDPYARACGVNGHRSMVADLKKTDPEGWEQDAPPAPTPEQVIYELHIRDFSWDPAGGFSPEDRGHFSALTRTGTTLQGEGVFPTGLDYLKRLGVTHIQILPMYDYGSVDEEKPEAGYNWGYDPVNYNIPEGSYSSNPYDGYTRIRELKEMIAALHKNGFRVIMDVVYNHTYELESCLFKTVPWYYYRQEADGSPSNGSGCGNDIASERSMCARYILESVLFWEKEYHLDGFRFDLMGLLDVPLMTKIREELDLRFGPGEKLVYGEPWRAGATAAKPGTVLADKGNLKLLPTSVGAFCDDTRDAVKGSVMDMDAVGFVNGGSIRADILGRCVTAWTEAGPNRTPEQAVTYLSCHDDWTLWDKLAHTLDSSGHFPDIIGRVVQANRLAAALYFCCQGRLFIHAGEEFGRTKGGIKNSYCSPSQVNRLDWARAWENRELVDWYRGLIALRQQLPGLCDKSAGASARLLWAKELSGGCAAVCLDNRGEGSRWQELLMVFNCSDTPCPVELPQGRWQLLADSASTFCWQESLYPHAPEAKPHSPLLLGRTA